MSWFYVLITRLKCFVIQIQAAFKMLPKIFHAVVTFYYLYVLFGLSNIRKTVIVDESVRQVKDRSRFKIIILQLTSLILGSHFSYTKKV